MCMFMMFTYSFSNVDLCLCRKFPYMLFRGIVRGIAAFIFRRRYKTVERIVFGNRKTLIAKTYFWSVVASDFVLGHPARLQHFEHHATSVLVCQYKSLATNDQKYVLAITLTTRPLVSRELFFFLSQTSQHFKEYFTNY